MRADILAQDIMDAYYQDYRNEDQFFELDFFERQVKYFYDKLIMDLYERRRQEIRQDGALREYMISFDPAWLTSQEVNIDGKDEIKLDRPVFSFPFDQNSAGIDDVIGIDYKCKLARTTESELFMLEYGPKKQKVTYWYVKDKSTIGLKKACGKGKLKVKYIASFFDGMELTDGFAAQIQQEVLQLAFGAKNGNVIDMSGDGNPNRTIETESNPDNR